MGEKKVEEIKLRNKEYTDNFDETQQEIQRQIFESGKAKVWNCPTCMTDNPLANLECETCSAERPEEFNTQETEQQIEDMKREKEERQIAETINLTRDTRRRNSADRRAKEKKRREEIMRADPKYK